MAFFTKLNFDMISMYRIMNCERGGACLEGKHLGAAMRALMPQPPQWLMDMSRTVRISKGEQVLRRDETLKYVYLVRRGSINIFGIGENGQENKVVTVPQGGIVGEMEAIAGTEGVIYSARAFEDSELLRVPLEPFLRWVRSDISACWGLTQVLASKLCAASVQSSQYTNSDAMQRLMMQLLQLGPGRISYTRQELAEACSVSLRTVNRCVKKLRETDQIGLSRGKIEISQSQFAALEEQMQRYS